MTRSASAAGGEAATGTEVIDLKNHRGKASSSAHAAPPAGEPIAESAGTQRWARAELLSLLSVSGTLAGLCITVVAFMKAANRGQGTATIVDDMLAICAAVFLACIYLIFWTLKTADPKRASRLVKIVDALFLAAITAMTLAAFVLVYTIW